MLRSFRSGIILLCLVIPVSSCQVKWVADYNASLAGEIVATAQSVDQYYDDLIAFRLDSIQADTITSLSVFRKEYRLLDNKLYGIYLKNLARPLNKNSTEIARITLEDLWRKYGGDFNSKPALLAIHRQRFTRNFEAMLTAEETKQNSN